MKLSIVATLYQSAPYINEFHQRASATAKQLVGDDYEIVFVNDGSPDSCLELAVRLSETDLHVVLVDLSRNFGHHKAMMTGVDYAKGDHVFLIDSDLEEEPEWLLDFSKQMQIENCDVVFGVQMRRKGNWFERLSGLLFYRCFKMLTGLQLSETAVTARLMSRRYVDALLTHKEREVFMAGLWYITGFAQQSYIVKKHSTSKTTYSFKNKMSLFVNSVTSFSNAPLVAIFYVGISISFIALIYIKYLIIRWFFLAKMLDGWTSVIASIWLLGGLIISFIGVVGIYLSKIYSETKQRPYTIVRNVYKKEAPIMGIDNKEI
jgi:putative glycosyltransferase